MNGAIAKTLLQQVLIVMFIAAGTKAWATLQKESGAFSSASQPNAPIKDVLDQFGIPQDRSEAISQKNEPKNADEQFNLGVKYELGQGVPQDYKKAAMWYRKAAIQGHTDAQNNLGWLHEKGKGVPQDYSEAVMWYREAAEQGNADAQFNLGVMCFNGKGIPQDLIQAHMWFSLSEEVVGKEASNNRKLVETGMTPKQIEEAQKQAERWLSNHKRHK